MSEDNGCWGYTMNERIKELAEQANLEIDPAHPDHNQKVLEKLAQLIVRKCVEQASIGNGHGNNQWDRTDSGFEAQIILIDNVL